MSLLAEGVWEPAGGHSQPRWQVWDMRSDARCNLQDTGLFPSCFAASVVHEHV